MQRLFAVIVGFLAALAAADNTGGSLGVPVTCNMMHNTDFWYKIPPLIARSCEWSLVAYRKLAGLLVRRCAQVLLADQ